MKFKREINSGEIIPDWYGVAFIDWNSDIAICYPIPFNLMFRYLRECLFFLKHGFITKRMKTNDAFRAGFNAGLKKASVKND